MVTAINTNENPVEWLEQYGDYLYAFAVSRLHDEAAAEDIVQETLLSALTARGRFSANSSVKTWLTAILKHKIIDHYRRASRRVSFFSETDETDFFDEAGGWREAPADWNATPEALLERKEFREILHAALAGLPQNLAAVFTLSEIEGLAGKEICEILNLSPNNFRVSLHRARLRLRDAIQDRWFGRKARPEMLEQTGEFVFSN
jgi:RNA polymerase sigma-70 factor, ECF subfamily